MHLALFYAPDSGKASPLPPSVFFFTERKKNNTENKMKSVAFFLPNCDCLGREKEEFN